MDESFSCSDNKNGAEPYSDNDFDPVLAGKITNKNHYFLQFLNQMKLLRMNTVTKPNIFM